MKLLFSSFLMIIFTSTNVQGACLDIWPSASCAYVVENEFCDATEFKTGTMSMKINWGESCKKTCGHCVETNYKIIESKYCLWSGENRGEWFDSSVDAEAYCDDNPSCIGYYKHEDDGMWGSCPSDSTEGVHDGTVLYKKECANSDGLTGFYYSHDGYWSKGYEYQGYITKVECADTCIHDCVGFLSGATTSTGICYHYKNRDDLVSANMRASTAKAYVKCSACNDNLPADYDASAVTCGLSWTCQQWAEVNACGYKWNSWEFGGCSASSAKIMDHCKASCNNCA